MSFGTRRPFEYSGKGRTVIQPENYDTCPVCGRDIQPTDDGLIPVVPCLVPLTSRDDYELQVIFGCSSCYRVQKRFNFVTVDELIERQRTHRTIREKPKAENKPKKAPVTAGHGSYPKSALAAMLTTYKLMGDILRSNGMLEDVGRPDSEESSMSRAVHCQGLPDDDIEFGMTDEQRARMDQAVHDASERTKLVPSESWNNRTASEILAEAGTKLELDSNGLPRGW